MKKHIIPNNDSDNKPPFQVPDNYFKYLPDRIMKRCREKESKRSFIRILKPAFSLAALFIGIALISYFVLNFINQNGQNSYKQDDIAEAEYTEQFSGKQNLMEAYENSQKKVEDKETDRYINYLLEENIDYGTLIRELEKQKKKNNEQ